MNIIFADAHGPVRGKAQVSPNLGLLYLASYLQDRVENVDGQYVSNWTGLMVKATDLVLGEQTK